MTDLKNEAIQRNRYYYFHRWFFLTPNPVEAYGCAPGYMSPPEHPSANVCIPITREMKDRQKDCVESLDKRYDLSSINTQLARELIFYCTNAGEK